MTLAERAHAVQSREDFIAFLVALSDDLAANPRDWENSDLASFLAAMSRWAHDMDGYYANRSENLDHVPKWRVMTDLMMAARVYE